VLPVSILVVLLATVSRPAPLAGEDQAPPWLWPVQGPVVRAFDPPDSPFGSGHRGIDIATAPGTTVLAVADGTVTFAGFVGGRLFVTIEHGGGLESTYSFLDSRLVARDDVVLAGAPIATTGTGHTGSTVPHLHLGAKLDDTYVDPMTYLGPIGVSSFIRLAPL
jgi:murein DD-endopeptidase MepM/ murein hydrolase activator NlpD